MTKVIKALPKELADKIAAGEVVERPLSIVKELLENSIDSGADSVTIEIQKGGKEYIRVSDNGCGIPKEQLSLAFTRYATSKIATEADLNSICTLGFRGEALASIASVSETELISKTAEEKVGAKIKITASDIISIDDTACENGTTIIVRNLFFNIPARRKFLKPDNTESSLITDYVSKMALAYPNVKIRLISNSAILFSTPGKNDLKQTILTVYSPQTVQNLIDVSFVNEELGYKLYGYISQPTYSKTNRKWQIFFVNGRLVKNKCLENAVSDAYHDKLFEGHYPIVFLFLELDPKELDVNIHPHKTEVRFYEENNISEFVISSVRKALLKPDALNYHVKTPEIIKEQVISPFSAIEYPKDHPIANVIEEKKDSFFSNLRYEVSEKESEVQEAIPEFDVLNISSYSGNSRQFFFSNLTFIGQAFNTYLLCKDEDNVYFIDQHAAHERIMFEKLLKKHNDEESASQGLLTPIILELSASQAQMAEEICNLLRPMGFEIDSFGPVSYMVKAIPAELKSDEAEDFLSAFFDSSDEIKKNIQLKLNEITSKACKAAVKAHDKLSDAEVKQLFVDLDKCENPFSCPHGRPTFIRFSNYEIERMFKRK